MNRIIKYILICLAVSAVSCAKVEIRENKGMGCLSVDMNIGVRTKTVPGADALRQSAVVKIYKPEYGGLTRSYIYSQMPSSIYLVEDEGYRVDVEAGEAVASSPKAASWDSKSYKGSKSFDIVAGRVQTVQVEATVNNAVTQISFDPTVAENLNSGYTFTIGLDADDASTQLVYSADKDGAEGYFIVDGLMEPSFSWTFSGTLAKDGSPVEKTGTISDVEPGKLYKMTVKYTVRDGEVGFTLVVDKSTIKFDDTIVFEPVSTGLAASSTYEIWATHATVHADVDPAESEGKSVQFSYSADKAAWTPVDGVNDSEGTWMADITGLAPSTEYTYRLLIDGVQVGDEMTFTTEEATPLPNGSFEHYSEVSGQSFYKFYNPAECSDCCATKFWASGNGDEETTGSIIPGSVAVITTISTDCVDGSVSVLAQSKSVYGIKLAAGNLFTGQFLKTEGTDGGSVNFGRPWKTGSRPKALRISFKYSTGTMDYVNGMPDGVSLSKQDMDRAQIKVAIGTWDYKKYKGSKDSPVYVNTLEESTFVDYYTDGSTIANGDIIIYNDGYSINRGEKKSAATGGWIEDLEIPLDYRNLNARPTHIIISCAASQYGDYFTGSSSSNLYLDKFELVY